MTREEQRAMVREKDNAARKLWEARNPRPWTLYDGAKARRNKEKRLADAEAWIAKLRKQRKPVKVDR